MSEARRRSDGREGDSTGDRKTLELPSDPLRVIVALLIFLTVSRIHQHYTWIGALQPALLLFGAGAVYAFMNPRSVVLSNLTRTWPPRAVIGLGLMACLSVPFALSIGTAGSFLVNAYSKVLLVFGLIVVSMRGPKDLNLYAWSYVLGCGFLVWVTIFEFGLQSAGIISRLGELYMYDSNDLGVLLMTGLPLCLVTMRNSGKKGRMLSIAILLGIGASMARSGSRGGFLGLIAVGIGVLILLHRVSVFKRVAFVGVAAAGLFLMAPTGYWQQMETLANPTEDYNWSSDYGRKAIAERGLGYMLDRPLTGVGVGNFGRAEGLLAEVSRQRAAAGQGYRWTAPHNSFVQAGAEMGIPGLILFCALVFGGMGGMYRLRKRLPAGFRRWSASSRLLYDMALFLPVSFIGFAVTSFFVSFAYIDVIYLFTAFAAAVYVGVRQEIVRRAGAAGAAAVPTDRLDRARSLQRAG